MKGDLHNSMLYWLNEIALTKLVDNTSIFLILE